MERSKWQLMLHEDREDPFYEITNGQISLIANCGFVGEDEADEDIIFNRVKDELNTSGIHFHSGNKLEIKQHIEIQKQQYEIAALQSKCDRYEKALKEIGARNCDYQTTNSGKLHDTECRACKTNEALNGEGEKEAGNE